MTIPSITGGRTDGAANQSRAGQQATELGFRIHNFLNVPYVPQMPPLNQGLNPNGIYAFTDNHQQVVQERRRVAPSNIAYAAQSVVNFVRRRPPPLPPGTIIPSPPLPPPLPVRVRPGQRTVSTQTGPWWNPTEMGPTRF